MAIDRRKYLYRIKRLEIKSWLKYLMIEGKSVVDYVLGELMTGTEITIDNTVEKKFYKFDVKGNSTQETTTGKNVLNPNIEQKTYYGVTVTYDKNTQIITINGTCTDDNVTFTFPNANADKINIPANTTLYGLVKYISGSSQGYLALRGFNSGFSRGIAVATQNGLSSDITNSVQYTTDTIFSQMTLRFNADSVFNNLKIKVMFSLVDAVYEPYTYGASPNPSYPQEIYSAGDENLFDGEITTGSVINSSGGLTPSALGWYSNNFYPVKPNTSYTLTYNSTDYSFAMRIAQYTANKTFSTRPITNSSPYTFTTGNDIYFIKLSGGTGDSNIQLKATVGTISEKIVNKNLWNGVASPDLLVGRLDSTGALVESNSWRTLYIPAKPNTQYAMSGISRTNNAVYEWLFDKNKNPISSVGRYNNYTFTTTENTAYLGISVDALERFIFQIEVGETATTFVEHAEQTYTIPVQQPMRSIGTVRDEFINVNEEWKERHNIKIYNITGQEGFNPMSTSSGINYFQIPNKMSDFNYIDNNASNYLCNSFKAITVNQRYIDNTIFINSGKAIVLSSNNFNSLEEIKTWLQNNPTYILYETTTPVDLPCTSEQIAILENLPKSYNEQTNIYSLDVTPAYIEAQAYVKKEEG